jgi:hypothetical protein
LRNLAGRIPAVVMLGATNREKSHDH